MANKNYYYKANPEADIKFDVNHAQELINGGRFQEAADYYKQFEYTNALTKVKVNAKIRELEKAGRESNALKKNVGEENYSDIQFANNALKPGAYDAMRYAKNAAGQDVYKDDEDFAEKNPKFAAFNAWYRELGSSINYNEKDLENYNNSIKQQGYSSFVPKIDNKNDAVTLKVTMPYKKTSLFGDWGLRDRSDEADVIYEYNKLTGKTRDDLIADGVIITSEDNGDVSFIYDKNNNSAIALSLAIASVNNKYGISENQAKVIGYDKNGNETKRSLQQLSGETDYGAHRRQLPNNMNVGNLGNMLNIYKKGVNKSKSVLQSDNEKLDKVYSSTTFNLPGVVKDEDKKAVTEHVKSMAFADYEHYGYLDSDDGETLELFDEDNFKEFRRNMNGRNLNQIHYQGMTVNGVTGVLITLDPKLDADGNPKKGSSEMKMFIPNYLNSLTSYAINNSTDLQAQMELNNMQDYGSSYQYTFDDGSKGYIDDFGNVRRTNINGETYLDESPEARQTLLRDIDRDFIIKQADDRMAFHMNNKGQYNMDMVRSEAALIAYAAGEELYPGIPLKTTDGNPISVDDIFADNSKFMQNIENTCNSFTIEKIQDIFNIYNTIVGKTIKNK